MIRGESERYFTQIDSAIGSAFTSRFPVDLADSTVRTIVQKNIPNSFDSIFLARGSSEQFATIARQGAIALAPHIARKRAYESSSVDGGQFDAKQFVCRSLTDGRLLPVAYASYDRSAGFITDFSLVIDGGINGNEQHYYELRGALGDNPEEREFEIARFRGDQSPEAMPVDEAIATDFVAAINLQRAEEVYIGTLEGMLTDIIEASPAVHHIQHGDYNVFDGEELLVTISREEIITRGVAKLALYLVAMEQKGQIDPMTSVGTSKTFSLSYDKTRSPRYQADLSSFVVDPENTIEPFTRANQYEALSSELRDKPEIIFQALDDALTNLASLD